MVEIELKARVTAPELLKERISSSVGAQPIKCLKEDLYFSHPQDTSQGNGVHLFRLRRQGEHIQITRKWKKRRTDASEENLEMEFDSPAKHFDTIRHFFVSLGFKESAHKQKKGYAWPPIGQNKLRIELVEVGQLGWFVELEILLKSDSSDVKRQEARDELFAMYEQLGLPASALESNYYLDLLAAEDVKE